MALQKIKEVFSTSCVTSPKIKKLLQRANVTSATMMDKRGVRATIQFDCRDSKDSFPLSTKKKCKQTPMLNLERITESYDRSIGSGHSAGLITVPDTYCNDGMTAAQRHSLL